MNRFGRLLWAAIVSSFLTPRYFQFPLHWRGTRTMPVRVSPSRVQFLRDRREDRRTAHTTPRLDFKEVVPIGVYPSTEEKHSMRKTTLRRERRLAEDLQQLVSSEPAQFVGVWNQYLNGWCREAIARGHALVCGNAATKDALVLPILHKAERLLAALGEEAERLVGASTRELLTHECCKAVAGATDPRLYTLARG